MKTALFTLALLAQMTAQAAALPVPSHDTQAHYGASSAAEADTLHARKDSAPNRPGVRSKKVSSSKSGKA